MPFFFSFWRWEFYQISNRLIIWLAIQNGVDRIAIMTIHVVWIHPPFSTVMMHDSRAFNTIYSGVLALRNSWFHLYQARLIIVLCRNELYRSMPKVSGVDWGLATYQIGLLQRSESQTKMKEKWSKKDIYIYKSLKKKFFTALLRLWGGPDRVFPNICTSDCIGGS